MKGILTAMALSCALFVSSSNASAQVNINVNINVGSNISSQPAWGPEGYDRADYYYLPDLNIYYDVTNALFYYLSGSKWISASYLPEKYKSYDLYSIYKVVLNDEPEPWNNNKEHKKAYKTYKDDKTQTAIRYSRDSKYDTSKGNTKSWVDSNRGGKTKSSTSVRKSSSSTNSSSSSTTRQSSSSTNSSSSTRQSTSSSTSSSSSSNQSGDTNTRKSSSESSSARQR